MSVLLLCPGNWAFAQQAPQSHERAWPDIGYRKPLRIEQDHLPEVEMDHNHVYSLGELIDLAESRNPLTRLTWAGAKARAAAAGIARSELYPTLVAIATTRTFQEPLLLYDRFQLQDIGLFKSILRLHYTLFDFGARRSEIDAQEARVLAANFRFNNAHLRVIEEVTEAYYDLQNAIGLHKAAITNLRDARALEDAAGERLKNGLATRPDLLEARAAAAKAAYELQSTVRAERVAFGNLATRLTANPVHPFLVQSVDELKIPESLPETVEDSIQRAMRQRPDLLERIAGVRAAFAEVKKARAAYYPSFEFEGETGVLRAWGQQEQLPALWGQVKVYDARITARWTVFDGLKRENELARAKAERVQAEAEVHEAVDKVTDEVWKAYRDAETSLEQRKAANALLRAATESYEAAFEAYRYGVRNILDVLSAERELAQARAVEVTARTEVLNSMKDLAYRTGALLTEHAKGRKP